MEFDAAAMADEWKNYMRNDRPIYCPANFDDETDPCPACGADDKAGVCVALSSRTPPWEKPYLEIILVPRDNYQ